MKKRKQEKVEEIKIPMKFNPGTMNYEPDLRDLNKTPRQSKLKSKNIIIDVIIILSTILIFLYLLKYLNI